MKLRLIPLMVAAALMAGAAHAADTPKAEAAKRAELEQARAELAKNGRRVAELTRELYGEERQVIIEREMHDRQRPGVGIVMSPNEKGSGVLIAAVSPDGPAAKAGLRAGDVLRSVDGKAIAGNGPAALESARTLLADFKLGQAVKLGYVRAGEPQVATVKADNIRRAMVINSGTAPRVHTYTFTTEYGFPPGPPDGAFPTFAPGDAFPVVNPDIELEIERIGMAPCAPGSEDCGLTTLTQAFRWNGLNLASMDAKLGRYFGTSTGVLVLSGGPGLAQLEPGDVIQRIDGKPVATPRDAMRALRAQDTGDQVKLDVLRERKPRTVQVTVPEAPPMRFFAPPAPPAPQAPPAPPRPPRAAPPAPPAPPAPHSGPTLPAPPAPPANETLAFEDGVVGKIVSRQRRVDADGDEVIVIRTRAPATR